MRHVRPSVRSMSSGPPSGALWLLRAPAVLRVLAPALVLAVVLILGATGTASAHHQPCHPKSLCEVPEVPWPLVLPAASAGMAGAYYLAQRVRGRRGDGDDD